MNGKRISTTGILALLLLGGIEVPAYAQATPSTFDEVRSNLTLKQNEKIEITDENGNRLKGRVESFSAQTLTVSVKGVRRDFKESQVLEIRHRKPDKWWNGMLIGLGTGAGSLLVGSAIGCRGDCDSEWYATAAFGGGLYGMGIGALVDFMIKKNETVFSRKSPSKISTLSVAPFSTKTKTGAKLSFRF